MKTPKIDWPNDEDTTAVLDATKLSRRDIETRIEESIARAQLMARRGVAPIAQILKEDRSEWERLWNGNSTLTKWFGRVTRPNHVKDVHRMLDRICDRFTNKTQKIKVRAELPRDYAAQNLGGPLSPNTFKVAPGWIELDLDTRAAVMIHESAHSAFKDQKLDGEVVYGSDLALDLADENASRARRSPENYEHYCLEIHDRLAAKRASVAANATTTTTSRKKTVRKKSSRNTEPGRKRTIKRKSA